VLWASRLPDGAQVRSSVSEVLIAFCTTPLWLSQRHPNQQPAVRGGRSAPRGRIGEQMANIVLYSHQPRAILREVLPGAPQWMKEGKE
jgi:hypothetical protein